MQVRFATAFPVAVVKPIEPVAVSVPVTARPVEDASSTFVPPLCLNRNWLALIDTGM